MTCLSTLIHGSRVPTTQMARLGNFISSLDVKMVDQSADKLKTVHEAVVADMRNGVYAKPLKGYDIKHFLKYSANYKSTSCYKNENQRKSKENSVKKLREHLLKYYDENGTLKPNPVEIAVIHAARQDSFTPADDINPPSKWPQNSPSGSFVGIEEVVFGDNLEEISATKERLLAKFTRMEAAANGTPEAQDGIAMFKGVMLDLENFTAIIQDDNKNILQKVHEINEKYKIACHQNNLLTIATSVRTIAGMLVITPDENITPDWVEEHFYSNLPCIEARLNGFYNWTPVVKIEQNVDSNQTAETNIGIFHSVYIDKNPTCDDAAKFYSWITDLDGFLNARVKGGGKISTQDVYNYIIDDPLYYCAFSDESLIKLNDLLGRFNVRF